MHGARWHHRHGVGRPRFVASRSRGGPQETVPSWSGTCEGTNGRDRRSDCWVPAGVGGVMAVSQQLWRSSRTWLLQRNFFLHKPGSYLHVAW